MSFKQGHQNEHSNDIRIPFSAILAKYRKGTDSLENFVTKDDVFFLLLP